MSSIQHQSGGRRGRLGLTVLSKVKLNAIKRRGSLASEFVCDHEVFRGSQEQHWVVPLQQTDQQSEDMDLAADMTGRIAARDMLI